jgi:hypothetical protein
VLPRRQLAGRQADRQLKLQKGESYTGLPNGKDKQLNLGSSWIVLVRVIWVSRCHKNWGRDRNAIENSKVSQNVYSSTLTLMVSAAAKGHQTDRRRRATYWLHFFDCAFCCSVS